MVLHESNYLCSENLHMQLAGSHDAAQLSLVTRKPAFFGNREADQRLCFRFIDSTISLLSKSEISSL